MTSLRVWLITAVGVLFAAAILVQAKAAVSSGDTGGRSAVDRALSPLGAELPAVDVLTMAGERAALRELVAGGPALVVVAGKEDCLSCANFPLEMRIVRNRFPNVRPVFVGSGADTAFFRAYAREQRIQLVAYLDPAHELLLRLTRSTRTPYVLLVDREGVIVFADSRTGPDASRQPIGRVLLRLTEALDGP